MVRGLRGMGHLVAVAVLCLTRVRGEGVCVVAHLWVGLGFKGFGFSVW